MTTKEIKKALTSKAHELAQARPSMDQIAIAPAIEVVEDIQQINNREIALELMSRNWMTSNEVHAALGRVSEGTYGICESCEEAISPRRLQAIPWAKYCVACQRLSEDAAAREEKEAA